MTRGQLQALCEMLIKRKYDFLDHDYDYERDESSTYVSDGGFRAVFEECVQKVLNGP